MKDTADLTLQRILIDAARAAYLPEHESAFGIPIDLRCPGCGQVKPDGCGHPLCSLSGDDE